MLPPRRRAGKSGGYGAGIGHLGHRAEAGSGQASRSSSGGSTLSTPAWRARGSPMRGALAPAHVGEEADGGVFRDGLDEAQGNLLVVDEDGDRWVDVAVEREAVDDAGALGVEALEDLAQVAAAGDRDCLAAAAVGAPRRGNVNRHPLVFRIR